MLQQQYQPASTRSVDVAPDSPVVHQFCERPLSDLASIFVLKWTGITLVSGDVDFQRPAGAG